MNLEQSLRELAQDDAKAQVPAHVDAAVMAAWDSAVWDERKRAAPGRRTWLAWAMAAVAVSLVALAAVLTQRQEGAPRQGMEHIAERSVTPEVIEPARESIAPRIVVRSNRSARARTRPVAPPPMDAGYVLVPDMASDGASLTLMRVRMPRSAFSNLGVPIANPDGDGLVDVEVLVGEDGVARSIRRAAAVGWPESN
jgi:hypothetical protein